MFCSKTIYNVYFDSKSTTMFAQPIQFSNDYAGLTVRGEQIFYMDSEITPNNLIVEQSLLFCIYATELNNNSNTMAMTTLTTKSEKINLVHDAHSPIGETCLLLCLMCLKGWHQPRHLIDHLMMALKSPRKTLKKKLSLLYH